MVLLYADGFAHYPGHRPVQSRVSPDLFTRKATMTTFIDLRAAALGITGELSNADRIALDHNAQLERCAIAAKALAAATVNTPLLNALMGKQFEHAMIGTAVERHNAKEAGVDVTRIPVFDPSDGTGQLPTASL